MQCSYNTKVLKVIKKINKRYNCKNTETWYLPIEDYPTFNSSLADDPEFEFEESESKIVVFIKKIADKIELKFRRFINEFKKYLEFDGRRNNSADRKISMPQEHLEKVITLSTEMGFEIDITDEVLVD